MNTLSTPTFDLHIARQGVFAITVPLLRADDREPLDLTGCTADLSVYAAWPDANPLLSINTTTGIALDVLTGELSIALSATQVEALAGIDVGVYRLRLIDPQAVPAVLLIGRILLSPELHRGT